MTISAKTVRYIKLGKSGSWADASLKMGELHFGYDRVTEELALEADVQKIKKHMMELGRSAQAATRDAREVIDFYHLGDDCLWITFAKDHLWWTFAGPQVSWITHNLVMTGQRIRKSIGGWRNTDINGLPLRIDTLNTKLTKVAGYRRTICAVEAQEYLLRRINGREEPAVARMAEARTALLSATMESVKSLHQSDFETMVDIIFARSGWNRVSALGGTQPLIDIELEQPITAERAAVQVKSSASQKTLDEYIDRVDTADRFDRFFFICHSPKGVLTAPTDRDDIHVWTGGDLAAAILRTGMSDWIMEKTA
jgi:hypothetical protein